MCLEVLDYFITSTSFLKVNTLVRQPCLPMLICPMIDWVTLIAFLICFFSISFRVYLPFRNRLWGKIRTNAKLWVFQEWVEMPYGHFVTVVFMSICSSAFQSMMCTYSLNSHLFFVCSPHTYKLSHSGQKSIFWQWNSFDFQNQLALKFACHSSAYEGEGFKF